MDPQLSTVEGPLSRITIWLFCAHLDAYQYLQIRFSVILRTLGYVHNIRWYLCQYQNSISNLGAGVENVKVTMPACNLNIHSHACIWLRSHQMTILTPLPDDVSANSDWVRALVSALIFSALEKSICMNMPSLVLDVRTDYINECEFKIRWRQGGHSYMCQRLCIYSNMYDRIIHTSIEHNLI